jgi:hypothetical protein
VVVGAREGLVWLFRSCRSRLGLLCKDCYVGFGLVVVIGGCVTVDLLGWLDFVVVVVVVRYEVNQDRQS